MVYRTKRNSQTGLFHRVPQANQAMESAKNYSAEEENLRFEKIMNKIQKHFCYNPIVMQGDLLLK